MDYKKNVGWLSLVSFSSEQSVMATNIFYPMMNFRVSLRLVFSLQSGSLMTEIIIWRLQIIKLLIMKFLQPPITSQLLNPHILLSFRFSFVLPSVKVKDQISRHAKQNSDANLCGNETVILSCLIEVGLWRKYEQNTPVAYVLEHLWINLATCDVVI
jgi:hypothetical protein